MYKKSLITVSALAMLSSSSLADTTNLSDVLVTAKSNKSIDDVSSTVTVITAQDLEKMNAENLNLKDILVKQAGIIETDNSTSLYGRKNISVRGLDSSYSLILVDGKRIAESDEYIGHSDFQYSWVPASMIERIEIVKGSKSSIYGSSAVGGVINIITKKNPKNFYAEVSVQKAKSSAKKGGDEENASMNIGGNLTDKLSVFIGASTHKREHAIGSKPSGFSGLTINEALDIRNGNIKLKYNFDDTQNIYASYQKGEETRSRKRDSYGFKRDMYNIGYKKNFEDVSFDINYAKTKYDIDSLGFGYLLTLTNESIKAESKITALKNNYIVIGAELAKRTHIRDNYKKAQKVWDFKEEDKAIYIQDELELGNFILSFGGRYDDKERYGSNFISNLGLVYKIDDKQRVKLNYGEGFKTPTIRQGTSGFIQGNIQGNDNLKAETSKSYELSYEIYADNTTFKSTLFQIDLKNQINTKKVQEERPQYTYVNIGEVSSKGFEASIDYNFNKNHSINANYTFVKAKDKKANEELLNRPKHTINVGLSSNFAYGISSYVSASYIGKQIFESFSDKPINLDSYILVNARVSKELTKNLNLRIGADNIFNKDLGSKSPYTIKQRIIYAGLKYKF